MQSQRMCRHSRPKPPSNLKILHPTCPAPRQTHRGVPLLHDDDLPKPWRTWKAKSTGNMERNLALNRASPAGKTFLPWAHHDRRGPSGRGKSSALPAAIYPVTPCPSWQGRRECDASCPFLPRQNCDRTSRQAAMSTSRKHLILETYFFPLRTKALKGKKKRKEEEREGEREKGVTISQEGFREHPWLFVEHAIEQEADKRHPATKEMMQSRHFKHVHGCLSGLTFQTRAIKLRHGLIFKDTIGKGHAKLIGTLGVGIIDWRGELAAKRAGSRSRAGLLRVWQEGWRTGWAGSTVSQHELAAPAPAARLQEE